MTPSRSRCEVCTFGWISWGPGFIWRTSNLFRRFERKCTLDSITSGELAQWPLHRSYASFNNLIYSTKSPQNCPVPHGGRFEPRSQYLLRWCMCEAGRSSSCTSLLTDQVNSFVVNGVSRPYPKQPLTFSTHPKGHWLIQYVEYSVLTSRHSSAMTGLVRPRYLNLEPHIPVLSLE